MFSAGAVGQTVPPGEEQEGVVHWAFGSFLGTGWYRVSEDRNAFVFRIPPRWTFRPSSIDETGRRQTGIEFRFPVTLGLAEVEQLDGILDSQNFSTISFTPGIELEIPVNRKWSLRPYINLGWGTEFNGGESGWVYHTGIKSRYALPGTRADWGFLTAIQYAGFTPDNGESSDMLNLMAGLETRHHFGKFEFDGNPLFLEWHATYSRLSDPASFNRRNNPDVKIHDIWEAGVSISMGDIPFRVLGMNFQRFGLSYQLSSDGKYRAIKFNVRSPFSS